MKNILIIEDEALAAKRLIRLLGEMDESLQVMQVLTTVRASKDYLSQHLSEVDLILMDIHLGDGNSFEIFEELKITTPIIFVTAFEQYALKAFDHMSLSYLLKPIQKNDLEVALDKYRRFYKQQQQITVDFAELAALMQQEMKVYKKRFLVNVGDKIRYISVEEIAMFYADNKACFVITHEGKRNYVNYTLEKLVKELDPDKFHRINRKVITNISNIQELLPYSKSKLLVKTKVSSDFDIFCSAENIKKLKDWMNR